MLTLFYIHMFLMLTYISTPYLPALGTDHESWVCAYLLIGLRFAASDRSVFSLAASAFFCLFCLPSCVQ